MFNTRTKATALNSRLSNTALLFFTSVPHFCSKWRKRGGNGGRASFMLPSTDCTVQVGAVVKRSSDLICTAPAPFQASLNMEGRRRHGGGGCGGSKYEEVEGMHVLSFFLCFSFLTQ
mmetsp:Transcript_39913/g.102898  ORF Transcript_39913/g.102898 Transcript_39913/m.102898 type:complete len:117 (+) Transcript_39913:1437-1787(+)